MRIGFYGGCFNPPSKVHIDLAKIVIEKFELDALLFVPVGDYYDKKDLIPGADRLSMLKLAIENEEKMGIEEIAIKSKSKLYASDTFKLLKGKYYNNNELFYIMGSDNFRKMPHWKNYKDLINHYNFIVIERERKKVRVTTKNNVHAFIPDNINETEEIDSSKIRKMISDNEDVSNYLNKGVYKYIQENGLYKN